MFFLLDQKVKAGLKWLKIFSVSLKEGASARIAPTKTYFLF
jgi:hypothetical protein